MMKKLRWFSYIPILSFFFLWYLVFWLVFQYPIFALKKLLYLFGTVVPPFLAYWLLQSMFLVYIPTPANNIVSLILAFCMPIAMDQILMYLMFDRNDADETDDNKSNITKGDSYADNTK